MGGMDIAGLWAVGLRWNGEEINRWRGPGSSRRTSTSRGSSGGWRRSTPPKLALEEVLARLRDRMREQRRRGVTVEQLAGVLSEMGIEVGVRNLKHFIEKGELMGGRPRRGTSTAPEADAGSGRSVGEGDTEASGAAAPAAVGMG